jgi:hypothetical protein
MNWRRASSLRGSLASRAHSGAHALRRFIALQLVLKLA